MNETTTKFIAMGCLIIIIIQLTEYLPTRSLSDGDSVSHSFVKYDGICLLISGCLGPQLVGVVCVCGDSPSVGVVSQQSVCVDGDFLTVGVVSQQSVCVDGDVLTVDVVSQQSVCVDGDVLTVGVVSQQSVCVDGDVSTVG